MPLDEFFEVSTYSLPAYAKNMKDSKKSVLVLNGPNLNLLGLREPSIYGSETLKDVEAAGIKQGEELGAVVEFFQSNWEGALIDRIQQARTDGTDAIVINPAAFTHTSVAIRDALLGVDIPFIELHVSNVHAREPFRHHSYLSDKAKAVIMGCGVAGYGYAIQHAIQKFPSKG